MIAPNDILILQVPTTGVSVTDAVLLCILLTLSGLFSASETAITALDNLKLRSLIQNTGDRGGIFRLVLEKRTRFITTLLILNTIVIIGVTVLTTNISLGIFGEAGLSIATVASTILVLTFGEITPKSIAVNHVLPLFQVVVKPIYWMSILMLPVLFLFESIAQWTMRLFRVGNTPRGESMQDLQLLIDVLSHRGQLDLVKGQILNKALSLDNLKVRKVVKSRVDMQTIDYDASLEEAIALCLETGYSRLPVQEESKDKIVGIITLKQALQHHKTNGNVSVSDVMAMPVFVPETKRVADLLKDMLSKQLHLVIVTDEYGGTVGLVTLEDVLEELVGEIYDETDDRDAN
ncbi:hemolysin family protein [Tumidithrix elongata RA019]|uniref:Hemolysin family protein n=1 Tax=Tumidithrix elongata BACA0141 TaxID=2716417 RepID=A0AAW9PQ41_9CYAN|nr:hemolysin family protein [Tumidithrix elongata RA019]